MAADVATRRPVRSGVPIFQFGNGNESIRVP